MTDPQLANNNNNTSTNNNNDGEPKYLHKKFKKMATTEVVAPLEVKTKTPPPPVPTTATPEPSRHRDPPKPPKESSKIDETSADANETEPSESKKSGYVCPYCKLSCAKPSVLQKHIRAHTNERPYPCVPCGFAFKTKSNLYKHCRSRAHALKMEGVDTGKVSEDSDMSLSDSASNGTGTPPPPPSSTLSTPAVQNPKTVKTGKIYKPKFHTALQCVNSEPEITPPSPPSSSNSSSSASIKPNSEQVQEHIDKIIADNQATVYNNDPELMKRFRRHQYFLGLRKPEQPLNLTGEETTRKRGFSESFAQEEASNSQTNGEGSIIKDLLLKTRTQTPEHTSENQDDSFTCPTCRISYSSSDNLEAHRRYYCKNSDSPKRDFQLDLDKKEDYDGKGDFYNTVQPLPSPGPLLGNTRLVDAYGPPPKIPRTDAVPTTLRSLEELSKYPRPNSLQMFGGEVRILDNTGETKTMRIEPRQTNSPPNDHNLNNKCITTETSSIVVRSGLHSGGTLVHKPSGTPSTTPSTSISLPNTPKILAPIIPNISTPNLAPTMSCYSYLEPHLNPLTSITAYNPLTLPQAGIASILHGGKVIPYVPGMPGPHTLSTTVDISPVTSGTTGYKVIPGIPGLHMIPQPLDLASPVRTLTPSVPGIPGPTSNAQMSLGQPLDLASPAKDPKIGFKHPNNGIFSPKVSAKLEEKYKSRLASTPTSELPKSDVDRHPKTIGKYKILEQTQTMERIFSYPNGVDPGNSFSPRSSPKEPSSKYDSPPPQENGRIKQTSPEPYVANGARLRSEFGPSVIIKQIDPPKPEKSPETLPSTPEAPDPITEEEEPNPKFLRPTSLPLKPGTFTPKRHHGITPTANTLPLISPETPRPKKSYGQLYLNGHAYTYLGLKCSTRVFYCTLNRPQPMYVSQQHGLSMYSNWKICKEAPPDLDMAHYDSRHRPSSYTVAWKKQEDILTHSSQRPNTPTSPDSGLESDTQEKTRRVKIFDGGFESNEDYTYVRGRGRGRYVCEECGIRCKKPSMLKKHIRTHTDVRPYTCKHCSFSFKTKGNLTKHMKSKAHYKKCVEMGVTPVPTTVCDENIDKEAIARLVAGGANEESTDEDEESDGDDSDESGSEEHEAAQSLLSLSQPSSKRLPGLLPAGRPTTYPYALTFPTTSVTTSLVSTTACSVSAVTVTSTTVIQSEASNRYYFPSSRSSILPEETRDSVIRSSKIEDSEVEMEEVVSRHQPMDLTTKTPQTPLPSPPLRSNPGDILTPVSEPVLMQAIVHTMERLPLQGREWKPDEGHMLQAYLTERHVMDSKMKLQYRVGSTKNDKQVVYSKEFTGSRSSYSSCTPTVTYTDPSRMQNIEVREKEDVKMEMRERRPFDIESLHPERESQDVRIMRGIEQMVPQVIKGMEAQRQVFGDVSREVGPGMMKNEFTIGGQDRGMEIVPRGSADGRYERPSQEFKVPTNEVRSVEFKEGNRVERSPGRESGYKEHRVQGFEVQGAEGKVLEIAGGTRGEARGEHGVNITELAKSIGEGMKHVVARKVVVGGPGFRSPSPSTGKPQAEFLQPVSGHGSNYSSVNEEGRSVCGFCNKVFNKPSHLRLHINIHYFERRFRCESCAVSFRTKGHLTKHERSVSHHNKVSMTSTFGAATTSNPRPFKCEDCKIAFRIHGHLAKHLRSKMHIMKLECIGKLPFGTYAEMERSGVNLNDIDTTDCDNSLSSLQILAYKLYEKDPSKMGQWDPEMGPPNIASGGETSSDEGEPIIPPTIHQYPPPPSDIDASRAYHMSTLVNTNDTKQIGDLHVPNTRFDDNSLPYKCQICPRSLRTINELQVHCYMEHGDRGKENTQTRIGDDIIGARDEQSRQKSNDT
ncbi:uncharacterized protein LOC135170838 [Diachasmimorpha longicaudata]|uniref:uncharacterized protein LOC135170838 n=1 Tax=Diachasmimorpha longicaudata TaxID=58733 RepID=UPI0030B8A223